MKRLQLRLAKWLLKRLDFKFVAVAGANGNIDIEGDRELLVYVDMTGFLHKKEPLRREVEPEFPWPTPISKLPPEVVAEIALNTEPFSEEIKKQNKTID